MTERFQLAWELVGSGWATCRVDDGASQTKLVASYLTDALHDLVSGMTALYTSRSVQRFSFESEPQELRWVLRRHEAGVDVAIYKFPDSSTSWGQLPDSGGTLLWASTVPRAILAHVVLEAAQTVLREHGEEGYRAKWKEHAFPAGAVQDLQRLHLREDDCGRAHEVSLP